MNAKKPVGRPPKHGTSMTNAQRQKEYRQREKVLDQQRFLEIMSVIREEYCNESPERNRNEKERS